MPRLAPTERTAEYAIVQSARISYNLGLKSVDEDNNLVKYLIRNSHTSPLENVKFTFHIKCPKFVTIQFLRHRCSNVNEFSQRYAELPKDEYYSLLNQCDDIVSIRGNNKTNKQGSDKLRENEDVIKEEIGNMEKLMSQVFEGYHKLIKLGLAKELSRNYLPMGTYTEMYYTMDLNNLLKFLKLRLDNHAQAEISVYAEAMLKLITPIVPVVIEIFKDQLTGTFLCGKESDAISNKTKLDTTSKSEMDEFEKKKKLLNI